MRLPAHARARDVHRARRTTSLTPIALATALLMAAGPLARIEAAPSVDPAEAAGRVATGKVRTAAEVAAASASLASASNTTAPGTPPQTPSPSSSPFPPGNGSIDPSGHIAMGVVRPSPAPLPNDPRAGIVLGPPTNPPAEPNATLTGDAPRQPPPDARDLYLEVTLNGQRTALIAHFVQRDQRLYATAHDLDAIGLRTGAATSAPSAPSKPNAPDTPDSDTDFIGLDTLPGLRYRYDATSQSIALDAPDTLRKAYVFDTRAIEKAPPASAGRGFVFNYDAYAVIQKTPQFALWSEERFFSPSGVFSNTGAVYLYHDQHRYTRFDTWWRTSDPAKLTTTQFGDTISSSLDWSRSLRIGGVQWRSNFALRPDLVTFPVPALSGSAVVPSAVDLYVNNVRQFSGNVPGGPFVITNVPGINGGGQATLVTRDALGRPVATTVPLYIDNRMLASGLSSYSFEAGFLRRDYGVSSFGYDPHPVASASMRRGVSDRLTVEAHSEVTSGVYNAGAGALLQIGQLGVINGSLAGSTGRSSGAQIGLGYQVIQSTFAVELSTLRATHGYSDLATRDGTPVPSVADRGTITVPFGGNQTAALSYIGYRYPNTPAAHIGSASYTINLQSRASVTISAFRDFGSHSSTGGFISATLALGEKTSVSATVGRQNGDSNFNVAATRPPDYDGGWGWGVQGGGNGAAKYQQGQAEYLGRYGQVTAFAQSLNHKVAGSLDATGSVVVMDGSVLPARRIDDGFTLVSTGDLTNVPVLRENRVIGTTDSHGHLLVPDLSAYQNNLVAIDAMRLPADTRIASTSTTVVPQAQSGVLTRFHVTHYRAASVILRGPDGALLPVGTRVHHVESGADTIVGYDGITFIDSLKADNHLVVSTDTQRFTTQFAYTRPTDGSLPTIGPLTCRPLTGDTP